MLTPKQQLAKIKWNNAQKKVDNSVKTLKSLDLFYSLSDGIMGNI